MTQNPKLSKLRTELNRELRACDIAFLFPGCNDASKQSSDLKNIVIGLDAHADPPRPSSFVQLELGAWRESECHQASDRDRRAHVGNGRAPRKKLLNIMVNAIPNELSDTQVHVGPKLQSNQHRDSDGDNWLMGFDGENCSCGVYSVCN